MDLTLWINILLPLLSILIPVFVTIYTVNNRIKNQNRENHQPYLALKRVEPLKQLDIYSYYLILIGRNYRELNQLIDFDKIIDSVNDSDITVNLIIQNIGYGVATNIKFYDLLTGTNIRGVQASNKEKNQKLFTTFDIAANTEKSMQSRIINLISQEEGIDKEDHNRILCVYKDLHNNVYSFIISINIKSNGYYDFFAYQPSSKSYKKWIKENNKEYTKIIKEYNSL